MFSRIRANRVGVAMTLIEGSKTAFLRKKTASRRGNGGVRAGKHFGRQAAACEYWGRVRLLSFLLRGISRRGARAGKHFGRRVAAGKWAGAGTWRAISTAGDFSTNARNDNVVRLVNSVNCDVSTSFALEMTTYSFWLIRLIAILQKINGF